jgi:signal transduction histidine kinase/DNA-binding NarL/FixJ family response regulator
MHKPTTTNTKLEGGMKTPLHILHLEDDPYDVERVQNVLKRSRWNCEFNIVASEKEYRAALASERVDVILSDSSVPGFDGTIALEIARSKRADVPFIFLSGFAGVSQAREKLAKSGASDCVSKSDLDHLPEAITRVLQNANAPKAPPHSDWYLRAMERLVGVVQELSLARDLPRVMEIVRHAARELTGADGATFVLRDGEQCHYADEDAIAPLWKGRRFPLNTCISGWAMLNREAAVIEDIYVDSRIPADAYRPTFVKSLVMVPIRTARPVGAIGNYWATRRQPRPEEVRLLQALADSTSVAMENVQLYAELEQKVVDRTARLQAANEELESFSYSVSHDLRAPLRHIAGYVEMLRGDSAGQLTAEGRRFAEVIGKSAAGMGRLIDDLLEFSRMGRAELMRGRVNMNTLVAEVMRELQKDTDRRTVFWETGDLPEVEGDRAMLRQVWVNLLSNAVKYTSKRERAEISVEAARAGGEWQFSISDNGAGFDNQYAGKLFGVFQRLHRADQFEGTGIGLANVRRIIARHGGRAWAEGEVDKGAVFHFTLPAAGDTA